MKIFDSLPPDRVQAIAAVAQTFLGLAAIAISAVAIYLSLSAQEQNTELAIDLRAREEWAGFMDTALAYPQYSAGFKVDDQTEADLVEYEWFISNLLYRAEGVLNVTDNSAWRNGIIRQLETHNEYVCTDEFINGQLIDYSDQVVSLVSEFCSERLNA